MGFKFNKNNSFNFIIAILLISFLMNIYLSIMNNRYKYRIGKENYNNLVEIKARNENALNIIKQCLKSESINSQELVNLYENYGYMSNSYNELWLNYNDYGKDEIFNLPLAKAKTNYVESNLVYSRIEDLIYQYMNNKLDNDLEIIKLNGQTLKNFIVMESLSIEVNDYYNKQKDIDFNGLSDEEKEKKIIDKDYWIDSLEAISCIMEKYSDKEFIDLE